MRTSRTLLPALLALLLLLTQQLGYAHAVSHWSNDNRHTSHGKQLPVEQNCAQCLVFAQLGAAPTSTISFPLASSLAYPTPATDGVQPLAATAIYAFHSRAPPVTL